MLSASSTKRTQVDMQRMHEKNVLTSILKKNFWEANWVPQTKGGSSNCLATEML